MRGVSVDVQRPQPVRIELETRVGSELRHLRPLCLQPSFQREPPREQHLIEAAFAETVGPGGETGRLFQRLRGAIGLPPARGLVRRGLQETARRARDGLLRHVPLPTPLRMR